MPKQVHVVSHGPHCLDGVAAAVAVARYQQGRAEVVPHFAGNSEVDGVLRGLALDPARDPELWITDISWREPETDAHLRALAAAGVRIYWIDHHRTALERFAVANASRTERPLGQVTLVTAVCDGHPSEIADAWGKTTRNTVFALYDARSLAVSLRRSPDCTVDLSRLAASLGGGGHAAAAGCELPELRRGLAEALAARIAGALA